MLCFSFFARWLWGKYAANCHETLNAVDLSLLVGLIARNNALYKSVWPHFTGDGHTNQYLRRLKTRFYCVFGLICAFSFAFWICVFVVCVFFFSCFCLFFVIWQNHQRSSKGVS